MCVRICLAVLFSLVGTMVCAAAAVATVLAVNWGLDRAWPKLPGGQLIFALIAPWGVVIFALLMEKVGKITERIAAV